MKEYPILFSAPMVRAILAGRKTQTRRLVKKWHFNPGCERTNVNFSGMGAHEISQGFWRLSSRGEGGAWYERGAAFSPYGVPGDRLWGRETAKFTALDYSAMTADIHYAADDSRATIHCPVWPQKIDFRQYWKPSIFMSRWASRLLLDNKGVKMERLLDISKEDAIAEGLSVLTKDGSLFKYGIPDRDGQLGNDDDGWHWAEWEADPRKAYFKLWDIINGAGSHKQNPWVWVTTFQQVCA